MIRKMYILALTFLFLLIGQVGFANDVYGGELKEVIVDTCDPEHVQYDFCRCNPEWCDCTNPLNATYPCEYEDIGDCTDSRSYAYPCDSGDPCDLSSYSFDMCLCDPASCEEPPTEPQDPPAEPDPCSEAEIAAGVAATNLFKNNAVSTTMSQMPKLFPSNQPPYSQQLEHGFNIKSVNGIISTTPIREGTATGLPAADYSPSITADLHDHPAPGAFAPSAQDLLGLDNRRDLMSGFTTSYVSSSDGNLYALYIDDVAKLNAFVDNNPGFVASNNNFNRDTNIGKMFWDTNDDLQRQGYTSQEAYTRATTLVLQDAGVSLLKSEANPIDFKKIDIIVVGDDPNGNTIIIIINDCK